MAKKHRKMWELDVGMKKHNNYANINRFYELINKTIDTMQTKAEYRLNPLKHPLSDEMKKRLRWIYIIHFECDNNITRASKQIAISRQWLSTIHSLWIKSDKDPCSLEPESRAPNNTDKRKKISQEIENRIIKIKKKVSLITNLDKQLQKITAAMTEF